MFLHLSVSHSVNRGAPPANEVFYTCLSVILLTGGGGGTARKRSLRRLCFYTCLSVILLTGGAPPANEVREGYVFTPVCQSLC